MKFFPSSKELSNHINHYWIVNDTRDLFDTNSKVYGYPGIRPEIIFILKGYLKYTYLGKTYKTNNSILASHISDRFLFDSSHLEEFIIVQFKPRSISSLLPFTKFSGKQLMGNSLCKFEEVFGDEGQQLEMELKDQTDQQCVSLLDTFFSKKINKSYHGFMMEMLFDLPFSESIPMILKKTGYSLSTLERYVKNETGLTPKAFLSLRKYKAAVEEINNNKHPDWQYFVEKYNYTDQSHFIKTIKRYTGFTPSQLINTPNLLSFRPEYY